MIQETNVYSVYKTDKLIDFLSNNTMKNEDIKQFFQTFSFTHVINQNLDKGNSAFVFKNAIKDDNTRSKITQALNKLHQQNLNKIIIMIREIQFQTLDELTELVNQCIQKIKRDNDQIKPLVAALCWELLSTYFLSSTGDKIYFRKLLLTAVKNDYIENTNFTNDNWSKDKGEKTMILIGILFNNKIIDQQIMIKIILDYKNRIIYNEKGTQEDYDIVEKSIHQLSCLISSIIMNDDAIIIYDDIDVFLEKQMEIYEEKKCISKKIRLVCKNCIDELRKRKK